MSKQPKPQKKKVSIEIGRKFIKVVEASFFKNKSIFRLAAKNIEAATDDDISQEITNFLKSLNISIKNVLVNIPRHLLITRFLQLPSIDDDEINKMLKLESAKIMPYATDEIISGYRIIEKLKDGYSNILLAVAQAEYVNRIISILRNAGLRTEKIALGSELLFTWYSFVRNKISEEAEINVAIINMDAEYVNIDIVEKGNLVYTRAFLHNGDTKIALTEILKTITTFKKERRLNIDKAIMSGAKTKIKEIEANLRDELKTTLEIEDQTNNIELDNVLEQDLDNFSFIELVSLLAKEDEAHINLLPEGMIEDNKISVLKKHLIKACVLILCIFLIAVGLVIEKLFDKSHYLSILDSKIKEIEPQVKVIRRMKEDIKLIKGEIQKKPLAIDVLSEVYKITPQGITFNYLDYESSRSLILRGSAPSLDDIIGFISMLEKSPYLSDVKIKYTSKRLKEKREMIDFEIICSLSDMS